MNIYNIIARGLAINRVIREIEKEIENKQFTIADLKIDSLEMIIGRYDKDVIRLRTHSEFENK